MDSNRIDLSDINKNKKTRSFSLLKKLNLLKKKPAGPGRDAEGKFTSGSGGFLQKNKFPWKRALPVIAIVTLAGGYFVWQSFASTKAPATPSYQYSIYGSTCSKAFSGQNRVKTDSGFNAQQKTCLDFTAEAGVYRVYRAVMGRSPSSNDYPYWIQRMVGGHENQRGRMLLPRAIQIMMSSSEARGAKGVMRGLNNTTNKVNAPRILVKNVYENLLGRTPNQKDIDYWVYIKAANKWSDQEFVKRFAEVTEVRNKYRLPFYQAVTASPTRVGRTAIKQVARDKQVYRTAAAKNELAKSRRKVSEMRTKSHDNNSRRLSAARVAARPGSSIHRGSLDGMNRMYIEVIKARLNGYKGKFYRNAMLRQHNSIAKAYLESEAVRRESPDLTNYQLTTIYKQSKAQMKELNNHISNANWQLAQARSSYNTAKNKYDAHQRYLAAVNACRAQGGNYTSGRCVIPQPSRPGDSDSSTAITEEKIIPPGPTEADKIRWCNAQKTRSSTVRVANGSKVTTRNPGWNHKKRACIVRIYTQIKCNGGYHASGGVCRKNAPSKPVGPKSKRPALLNPPCSGGRIAVPHGTYISCHARGNKSLQGYYPRSSDLACTNGYMKNNHSSNAKWSSGGSRWHGTNCKRIR